MSLIDEALKRARLQAEKQRAEESDTARRSWTPAMLPDRRRILRARIENIVVGILLCVLLVGVVWFVAGGKRFRQSARANAPTAAGALTPPSSVRRAELPPISSEVWVPQPARGQPPSVAARTARFSTADQTPVPERSHRAPAPRPPEAAASSQPSRPDQGLPATPIEGRTYVGEVAAPGGGAVKLSGIAFSETNPVAVLNGQVVSPGAIVEGMTVLEIQADHVKLRGGGATVLLKLP